MYRFLTSPRWLVGHVVVLGVVVLFANLGLWQLRRLEQVRGHNALVAARLSSRPQPLQAVLGAAGGDPRAVVFRRATVSGRYLSDQELLLGPRSRDGRPGYHVLTPLETGDGRVLLVDRGWVPYELDEPPVRQAAPPDGQVRVSGILLQSPPPPRFAPQPPARGRLDLVLRVDVSRLQAQFDPPLYPLYLQLGDQVPAQPDLPLASVAPELDEGNHFSYAVQWFLFAAVALVGYAALLYRTAREQDADGPLAPARVHEVADRSS
ncbi:MAG: SURF1 family protein [Actinomycetota bacterium]|nr:SURF1 family protein [Actinomycetota bacterium]